jgi:hypothetical protein
MTGGIIPANISFDFYKAGHKAIAAIIIDKEFSKKFASHLKRGSKIKIAAKFYAGGRHRIYSSQYGINS